MPLYDCDKNLPPNWPCCVLDADGKEIYYVYSFDTETGEVIQADYDPSVRYTKSSGELQRVMRTYKAPLTHISVHEHQNCTHPKSVKTRQAPR